MPRSAPVAGRSSVGNVISAASARIAWPMRMIRPGGFGLDQTRREGKEEQMLVRAFWPKWLRDEVDGFWVEATLDEAEADVFSFLSPEDIRKSRDLADRSQFMAVELGQPPRPYCFLVSRDIKRIEPCQVHFPFHQMWNAYSPFGRFPDHYVDNLDEIADIKPHDIVWIGLHTPEDE